MLYNSFTFMIFFLLVLLAYHLFAMPRGGKAPAVVLLAASIYFYAQYNILFFGLLLLSVVVSWLVCKKIVAEPAHKKKWLWAGIVLNVLSLGYFKYYIFIAHNLNALGFAVPIFAIALPLGISFYTFQQLAYILDTYKSGASKESFFDYLLYITYFPRLISGPIVRREEIMHHFSGPENNTAICLKAGLTLFVIGMAKKLLIADGFAVYADAVFNAADQGKLLTTFEAWAGSLAYTIQIYFDFSGYSDMAIGVSAMLGIPLPTNFASPYKALNVVDFWRRWHITLSRWLRDYIYIPLGGNRCAPWRRYFNAFITMVIGGIWHGANWTFILWGAMHGFFQMIYQLWASNPRNRERIPDNVAIIMTFLIINLTWVPFRANTLGGAMSILEACFRPVAGFGQAMADPFAVVLCLIIGWLVVRFAPNSNEIMAKVITLTPAKGYPATVPDVPSGRFAFMRWRANIAWAVATGVIFAVCIMRFFSDASYIYFQF